MLGRHSPVSLPSGNGNRLATGRASRSYPGGMAGSVFWAEGTTFAKSIEAKWREAREEGVDRGPFKQDLRGSGLSMATFGSGPQPILEESLHQTRSNEGSKQTSKDQTEPRVKFV